MRRFIGKKNSRTRTVNMESKIRPEPHQAPPAPYSSPLEERRALIQVARGKRPADLVFGTLNWSMSSPMRSMKRMWR